MRIAVLIPQGIVSSIYRSLVPMQALAQRGHVVHIEERDDLRNPAALLECDVVHFMRFSNAEMIRMARRLKQHGVAVVWEDDTDLAHIDLGPRARPMARQRILAGVRAMVGLADLVTTPSEALAERYRSLGAGHVAVLPNRLPPIFTRPKRVTPHPGVTVGWMAAPAHRGDYEALGLRDVFERLLNRHQHLEVFSVGLGLGLRSRRHTEYPMMDYGSLPEVMVHFDIGVAPLADTPLNRARSDVKLKEYAAMGTPWLASPLEPYAHLGEAEGGRLVHDDRWYQEIEALILDDDERRRLGRRARIWAESEAIEQHADGWEQAYLAAVERARAAPAVR